MPLILMNTNILIIATSLEESMDVINQINITSNISKHEYDILVKVIQNYNIDTKSIVKKGDIYKVDSIQGVKALYKTKHGKHKIKKEFYLTQFLLQNGFANIVNYLKTFQNDIYVKYKNSYFFMKDWKDGRECDLNNLNEILGCVDILAKFHKAASGIESKKYLSTDSNKTVKYLPSVFLKQCHELIKFKRIIDNKKLKSQFDIKYREKMDSIYKQGLLSINLIDKYDYAGLLKKAKSEKHICHGRFTYHNTLIDENNNIYISGLANANIDIRINDLGKLIRRALSNEEYEWSFKTVQELINTYDSILPLNNNEIGLLFSIIIFPYRFYKIGKRSYDNDLPFIEEKYMKKLNKQVTLLSKKLKFIEEFSSFYNINIMIDIY